METPTGRKTREPRADESRLEDIGKRLREARARDQGAISERRELEAAWEELDAAKEELHEVVDAIVASRETLVRERQRYLSLFDLAPDAYLVTDGVGCIREANHSAVVLLGVRRATLIGKPLAVVIGKEARSALRSKIADVVRRRKLRNWPITIESRRGQSIPVSVSICALETSDGGVELGWILRDRTEARCLEQERVLRSRAEDANREKSAFLASLSQELRTPMRSLVSCVDLLRHGELDAATREKTVEAFERSTLAELKLVTQILDMSGVMGIPSQFLPRLFESLRAAEGRRSE
jgi:PAS domain S-box-containing protein